MSCEGNCACKQRAAEATNAEATQPSEQVEASQMEDKECDCCNNEKECACEGEECKCEKDEKGCCKNRSEE